MKKVLIVGWGNYGKAIGSSILLNKKLSIFVYKRNNVNENIDGIVWLNTEEIKQIKFDIIILCVPSKNAREVLNAINCEFFRDTPIVSCIKGMDPFGDQFISETIFEITGNDMILMLSGASFADEMRDGRAVRLSLACTNINLAKKISNDLQSSALILDPCDDVRGLEIASVGKNVMAMGAGIIDGLNLGENFRAMYIAKGIYEMAKIMKCAGADPLTMQAIGPLGDLVMTCTSIKSRNYQFGRLIASNCVASDLMVEALHSSDIFMRHLEKIGVKSYFFEHIVQSKNDASHIKTIIYRN